MGLYYPPIGYRQMCQQVPLQFPAQHQPVQPGLESPMIPQPIFDNPDYVGTGKLRNKVALITGGDSGIGRAAAVAFAKEGADLSIVYYNEHKDAELTKSYVEAQGRSCLLIAGDIQHERFCEEAVAKTIQKFGRLDCLVNNSGVQFPQPGLEQISAEQLDLTFRINIYAMFYLTKAALKHMKKGSTIINTTSINAYTGNRWLIDYSSTKGAIVSFTRSMAHSLVDKGIRVNGIAPGPVWTPLQPASWPPEYLKTFGSFTPMQRPGQPVELAPAYVFLASSDSSYMTGQVLHLDGGDSMQS